MQLTSSVFYRYHPLSCICKSTRLRQVAEQSDDPGTIEAALEQAKRLRVDPDLISNAEGILDRLPDVSLSIEILTCSKHSKAMAQEQEPICWKSH